jgi:formate hydrogenlyase subunit 3/multisubunit Na+/H+ antiporter MnhD subunit
MPVLLALAPVPALGAALLAHGGTIALPQALLGVTLALDVPGAILLGTAALLWTAAGLYAAATLRGRANGGRFAVWWLVTLTGSVGVFMAADLISFYLVFAMVSLAAYGLVVDSFTPRARRAGAVYVSLAVLGEAFLLMGFVLLAAAAPGGSLLIHDAVAALPASPWRESTLLLLILGFGLKIGLVPLHVWMPLAYTAAPIPAAAVLSGAAVKAGVIGLIRFLPLDVAMPVWGLALVAVGLFSAFYGVAVGITQANPKTVLAYSSVSQMGVIAAVFGMGLAGGGGGGGTALAASFYAAHHILVKGGLFLAVGVAQATSRRRVWTVLVPAAVLALSLAGLPLTGGALAKLAIKGPLGDGVVGLLATLSAVGTTLLMLHFLARLVPMVAPNTAAMAAPARLAAPWLAIALAAVAVPWALYLTIGIGTLADAFSPASLWSSVWPILAGGVLAVGLWRWGARLPRIPEGDLVALADGAGGVALAAGEASARLDGLLRQWPVAGVSLLAVALGLATAMLAGR